MHSTKRVPCAEPSITKTENTTAAAVGPIKWYTDRSCHLLMPSIRCSGLWILQREMRPDIHSPLSFFSLTSSCLPGPLGSTAARPSGANPPLRPDSQLHRFRTRGSSLLLRCPWRRASRGELWRRKAGRRRWRTSERSLTSGTGSASTFLSLCFGFLFSVSLPSSSEKERGKVDTRWGKADLPHAFFFLSVVFCLSLSLSPSLSLPCSVSRPSLSFFPSPCLRVSLRTCVSSARKVSANFGRAAGSVSVTSPYSDLSASLGSTGMEI